MSGSKASQLVKQANKARAEQEEEEKRQLAQYDRCKKATPERIKEFCLGFHPSFTANQRYVVIEGPDPVLDFSFFAVNMHSDFKDMERGLSIIPPWLYKKKFGVNPGGAGPNHLEKLSPKDFNNSKSGSVSFLINPND